MNSGGMYKKDIGSKSTTTIRDVFGWNHNYVSPRTYRMLYRNPPRTYVMTMMTMTMRLWLLWLLFSFRRQYIYWTIQNMDPIRLLPHAVYPRRPPPKTMVNMIVVFPKPESYVGDYCYCREFPTTWWWCIVAYHVQ